MRDSSRFRFACFWGILLAALLLRGSMLAVKWSELTEDRDGYLGIAAAIMAGDGFCTPGSSVPTAFRPPLYPLLLSLPVSWAGSLGIAVVQLFLGLACVAGTMIWARQWIPRGGVCLAGAIVACDPLLLRYTSQPMTEVASAALTAWLLWAWCRYARQRNWGNLCLTGGLFGLAVLCRPAALPMPAVLCVLYVIDAWWTARGEKPAAGIWSRSRAGLAEVLLVSLIGLLVLLPWGVRNALVLGEFKLTTTHGGYTLLLGNNPVFYEAVARQPWGITWGDYADDHRLGQPVWLRGVNASLELQGLRTEFERDRAQYRLAWEHIRDDPGGFFRACLLRQARLWSPLPMGPEARELPRFAGWVLIGFYGAVYGLACVGLVRILSHRAARAAVWPGLALVLTLTCVHLFFWTNARMRAPIMPVLAVWAGCTWGTLPPRRAAPAASHIEEAT